MVTPEPNSELESEILAVLGLEEPPFSTLATDAFFFPSEQHLRALDFMRRVLCSRVSTGVITAEAGCGKSLLARMFLATLDDRVLVAHVQRQDLGPRDFLLEILRQFGFTLDESDRTDRRRVLERFLAHQTATGRICLLIVENAQSMHPSVLEELRHLATVEVDGARIVKLILLGRPFLNRVVDSPKMASMMQPGVPRISVPALSEDQVSAYVAHRLRAAGAHDADRTIPHRLMASIHRQSGGIPAHINRLCQQALAIVGAENGDQVTADALEQAAQSLHLASACTVESEDTVPDIVPQPSLSEQAMLVISVQGMSDGVVQLESSRVLLGRSELADVTIDSAFVSRYHALIVREADQDLLIDLGSTNGVLVNSKRVLRRVLKHLDLIQIGPVKVTYLNPARSGDAPVDVSATVSFAKPGGLATEEESNAVFAFGRFDEAG